MKVCSCGIELNDDGTSRYPAIVPGTSSHPIYCDEGANMDKVRESMTHDEERWIESYKERSTERVRAGVLAHSNGYSIRH